MNKIINNDNNTHVPQHVLRRQGSRGLRVLTRHADKHPVLASMVTTFTPVATAFINGHDELRYGLPEHRRRVEAGRAAVRALEREIGVWSAPLSRDIPGFIRSEYVLRDGIPDEIIARATRMLDVVERYQQSGEDPLPYVDDLLARLTVAIEHADRAWEEAQSIMAARQEKQAEVRSLAGDLQRSLVTLRQALRAVLGSRHRDFQKLRLARARTVDEEDPEAETGEAQPGDPVETPEPTTTPSPRTDDEAAAE